MTLKSANLVVWGLTSDLLRNVCPSFLQNVLVVVCFPHGAMPGESTLAIRHTHTHPHKMRVRPETKRTKNAFGKFLDQKGLQPFGLTSLPVFGLFDAAEVRRETQIGRRSAFPQPKRYQLHGRQEWRRPRGAKLAARLSFRRQVSVCVCAQHPRACL